MVVLPSGLQAVLAELTCADAYQFFQKVENGLDNYGRRVYGTYASPELASCSFTPGGCLGIAGVSLTRSYTWCINKRPG